MAANPSTVEEAAITDKSPLVAKEETKQKPENSPAQESDPLIKQKEEVAPMVKQSEESQPMVKQNEESQPMVKQSDESQPMVKQSEESEPAVSQNGGPEPMTQKNEESEPVVKQNEEPEPAVGQNGESEQLGKDIEKAESMVKEKEESEPMVKENEEPQPTAAADKPAVNAQLLVDRGIAEERARQAMKDARSRIKKLSLMVSTVMIQFIFLGVVVFFCFAPMFSCLSMTFIGLGLISGTFGLLCVCCKSRIGTVFYLLLGIVCLLFLLVCWAFYAYMLYKATLTAIAAGQDKVNAWVEDTTGGLIPQGNGGIFDIGKHLDNLPLPGDIESLKDQLGKFTKSEENSGSLIGAKSKENGGSLIGGMATAALLKECKKGIEEDGSDYMDDVQSVFFALASYGQMCNYSHHKMLSFRKWEYNCKDVCAFNLLAVGHKLKPSDPADVQVITEWRQKVSGLPSHQQVACYADSISTACAVENTSYVYVILGLILLFLLCGCCSCLCCLPRTLKHTTGYVRALNRHHAAVKDIKAAQACEEANGP
ncbi:putative transmembrane protein [Toxoplasma gondii GAB2-2007-GAL-DOM2]|uniref:Putative transmembrane protein n=2 Tax=Toxoplasma gondii TaxID=5811 RepID=A0A086KS25_TOXGO|nr:putative transmembrane protein [Toxoplasma gondii GAB2-2007-GAL-DOM2]KFG47193.1 putative transmembrane protein [Toxoplasma gondii FOU]